MTAPLLIISGPPGAGKSTAATAVAAVFDRSVLVRGDDFFGFLASGAIDPWLPASAAQNDVVPSQQTNASVTRSPEGNGPRVPAGPPCPPG